MASALGSLVATGEFTGNDGWTQLALGQVVGRFDRLVIQEREQVIALFEQTVCAPVLRGDRRADGSVSGQPLASKAARMGPNRSRGNCAFFKPPAAYRRMRTWRRNPAPWRECFSIAWAIALW